MSVLVGRKAPDFTAPAVLADGTAVDTYRLSEATQGRYVILFFYPHDFTFVCPSELIALHRRSTEFAGRGVQLVGYQPIHIIRTVPGGARRWKAAASALSRIHSWPT